VEQTPPTDIPEVNVEKTAPTNVIEGPFISSATPDSVHNHVYESNLECVLLVETYIEYLQVTFEDVELTCSKMYPIITRGTKMVYFLIPALERGRCHFFPFAKTHSLQVIERGIDRIGMKGSC